MAIDWAFLKMLRPLAWPFSPTNPPLSAGCAHTPSGKVITTHKKKHTHTNPILISVYFTPLPSSILEKEIILLVEQLVSIAAFS